MLRLTDSLARELMSKIKSPKIITKGDRIFEYEDLKSIGVLDPHACVGSEFPFLIESPVPLFYPELPYRKNAVDGFFLYRKSELQVAPESWPIKRVLIDPLCTNYEEQIDVSACSVTLPSDINKLTCQTVSTLEKLIEKEPTIIDCLNLNKR